VGSNLVVDISVFIDRLFIYSEERSKRAQNLFRYIDKIGLNVFEPQVFCVELAAKLVCRKPRRVARITSLNLLTFTRMPTPPPLPKILRPNF